MSWYSVGPHLETQMGGDEEVQVGGERKLRGRQNGNL